jgi:hypothetical protein
MRGSYLPTVVDAKYVSEFSIDVTFDDGTRKVIDVSQWFKGPVFEPLRNQTYFKKFFLDAPTIAWPNGVDIAPEVLYEAADVRESKPSGAKRRK